jgi:small subunit ribosomal protein S6
MVSVRDYEAVYIFEPTLEEGQITEKLERFHALVAGEDGGEVTAVDVWGNRPLAYPINDLTSGVYVVSHFTTAPERLPEFERILKLDDELMRSLVVVNEGDLQTSPAPQVERGEDEDESDDEEEE